MDKVEKFFNLLESTKSAREALAAEVLCCEIFPDPACSNDVKLECVDKLAEKIAARNKESCVIWVLKQFVYTFAEHLKRTSPESKMVIDYLQQVFGHSTVVKSFIDARQICRGNFFFSVVSSAFSPLFSDDAALCVLRSNPRGKIFVLFGFHPVIRKHVDLQVKWIKSCVRYSGIKTYYGLHNVTNEALKSVPVDVAYKFLKKPFLTRDHEELKDKIQHLSLQVIENIVFTYIVAHGKSSETEQVISQIKKIKEMCNNSDQ